MVVPEGVPMVKARQIETDQGIQGEDLVRLYDRMQRHLRDKGWMETEALVAAGITAGRAAELGPGPGYLGLEWLKMTAATTLTGIDISPDMAALARENAAEYGLADRAEYVIAPGDEIPYGESTFDAVFTNGSLHEWANPQKTFAEIWRVTKPGGRIFISDLRRDMSPLVRWFIYQNTKPKAMRPGFLTSVYAAYTPAEFRALLAASPLRGLEVKANLIGLIAAGNRA